MDLSWNNSSGFVFYLDCVLYLFKKCKRDLKNRGSFKKSYIELFLGYDKRNSICEELCKAELFNVKALNEC